MIHLEALKYMTHYSLIALSSFSYLRFISVQKAVAKQLTFIKAEFTMLFSTLQDSFQPLKYPKMERCLISKVLAKVFRENWILPFKMWNECSIMCLLEILLHHLFAFEFSPALEAYFFLQQLTSL